ncbi:MAG: hypothetical protein ACXVCS_02680 [Bdellovibrionota bacterium]
MKPQMLLLSIFAMLLLAATPRAFANCADSHGNLADQKFNSALRQGVLDLFKKKGIALDPAKIALSFSTSGFQTNFEDPQDKYVLFDGMGTVVSASNTKFYVSVNGPEVDDEGNSPGYLTIYRAVLTSDGFDREGNAINPHCTLQRSTGDISNYADSYVISNANTDKAIGKLPLPARLSLY